MPRTTIRAEDITDSQVGSAEIATDAVDTAEIKANAVDTSEIAALAVTVSEIAATTITPAKMANSVYTANRNKIINGDMNIWQRATSSTAGGSGYETADRWYFGGNTGAGKQTTRQSGTPQVGFQYHMKVDANGIPASNWVGVEQAIETSTVVPLRSQTITVSVYARKGASAQADNTYQLRLAQSNSTDARSTLNFGTGLTNTTMSLTTSFVRYSATVTVASDAVGISCSLVLTAGSSTATANDYMDITGIQLEVSPTATPFEHKTYGQELQACQRYYQKLYSGQEGPMGVYVDSSYIYSYFYPLIVEMRAAPTLDQGSSSPSFEYRYSGWQTNGTFTSLSAKTMAIRFRLTQPAAANSWGVATAIEIKGTWSLESEL